MVGAGALGSWISANLAVDLQNEAEIAVVDFDTVEPRNWQAGTQFYHPTQLGNQKVSALRFNIYQWLRVKIKSVNTRISKDNTSLLLEPDLIIDALDNYESRKLISEYCEKSNTPCVHVGFSPERTFVIQWNKNYRVSENRKGDFDLCTASGARSFIQYVAGLASTVVQEYVRTGEKKSFAGNRFSVQSL